MPSLLVRHVAESDPARFMLVRADGKMTNPVVVPTPYGFPVEGRPNSDLMRELRWYLEEFLDYPFPPNTDRAERIQAALRAWGTHAYEALFGSGKGVLWFDHAAAHPNTFHLDISSDDPHVLSWPWEALYRPETGWVVPQGQMGRRLNDQADPLPLSPDLPTDRVNILLVTARPKERDVPYGSIARPLIDLVARDGLPASVHVLRPPTFDRLRKHLRERPNYYHILHFDGHGGYGVHPEAASNPFVLQSTSQGHLLFEDDNGEMDDVTAETLSTLLREHRLPAVVLNACQSGMVDAQAQDAFASVAAALVRAGVRSVVAMAYSLYVSGAQEFLPAFYGRLFETGRLATAVRAGRQQMFAQRDRVCARGQFPLDDWLVPVVYEQDPFDFSFATHAPRPSDDERPPLPQEALDAENPYGFIGRDQAVLGLERAMRRDPARILIHGLGGVGKTTLARGFVQWLRHTEGLGHGCFWFTFNDIHNAEYVLNRMGEALFGGAFATAPLDDRLDALAGTLRDHPFVIVWDNFESVRGIEGAAVQALLSANDQQVLKRLLTKLRGGRTKVLITSRGEEDWLGSTNRWVLSLGGLHGEERWIYCAAILRDLGRPATRTDAGLVTLMDFLDGHPLAMRVLLPLLEKHTAAALTQALEHNLETLGLEGNAMHAKLMATLRFVEDSVPESLRPLLTILALHERFVDVDYLEMMATQVDTTWTRASLDSFTDILSVAGLLRDRKQAIYEIHPLLTSFLRTQPPAAADPDAWTRAFVDVMGSLANHLTPKPLHEQRGPFYLHEANFHTAQAEAKRLDMDTHYAALTQALAAYAQNTRNFEGATTLFDQLAVHHNERNNHEGAASTYHQLGRIAEEQRDFTQAEAWYKKAVGVFEKLGIDHHAASTYHQLGIIAQEQRDFTQAEAWYKKSLEIEERQGNEHGAAITYGQLGILAGLQEDYVEAGRWLIRCITTFLQTDDHHGAQGNAGNFIVFMQRATPEEQATLRALWLEAGLPSDALER